jgi:hypothetical protein
MLKTDYILAIIPHREKPTTHSLISPDLKFSSRIELPTSSGEMGYQLHTDILHKLYSLTTATEDEDTHNWNNTGQQSVSARTG